MRPQSWLGHLGPLTWTCFLQQPTKAAGSPSLSGARFPQLSLGELRSVPALVRMDCLKTSCPMGRGLWLDEQD